MQAGIDVPVLSVDSMQGREADVILLSCVRADPTAGLGFVADPRRVNVALSRARESLLVVGSAQCLQVERIWHSALKGLQKFAGIPACIAALEAAVPRGWGAPRQATSPTRRRERTSADREFEEELAPAPQVTAAKFEQRDSGIPDDWDASDDDDAAGPVEPPDAWDEESSDEGGERRCCG